MATLRVEIDIFSGRPNPVIELRGRDASALLDRVGETRRIEKGEPGLPPTPTLGYRGMIVSQVGPVARGLPRTFRLAHNTIVAGPAPRATADESIEEAVLQSAALREAALGRDFRKLLIREIERFRAIRLRWPWRPAKSKFRPARRRCRCAPLYEPAWWNDGGQKQHQNNCYNYGSDYRTDTFHQIPGGSQPGAAAGAMYGSITGPEVRAAAIADGLINSPSANNKCPAEGNLVALVIAPGFDFHWYRKGRTGRWSHKPGSTPVIAVDNSNAVIGDPRTADRGPYTQFTTFMTVMHGHVKIE
jgi:hypothetical protein